MDAKNFGYSEAKESTSDFLRDWCGCQPVAKHSQAGIRGRARNWEQHLNAPELTRSFQDAAPVGVKSAAALYRKHYRGKVVFFPPAVWHRSSAGIRRGSSATADCARHGLLDHRAENRPSRLAPGGWPAGTGTRDCRERDPSGRKGEH